MLAALIVDGTETLQACWADYTSLRWSPSQKRLLVTRAPFVSFSVGKARTRRDGIWIFRGDGSPERRISRRTDLVPEWIGDERILVGTGALPSDGVTWDVLDLRGRRVAHIAPDPAAPEVWAWEVSPDGRYLVYVADPDGQGSHPFHSSVYLYRTANRRIVGKYGLTEGPPWTIAWSPDSRYVYAPENDRDWCLDVAQGRLEEKVRALPSYRADLPVDADFAVSTAGEIAVCGRDTGLNVIDWATGRERQVAKGEFGGLAFGRDPALFVCAGPGGVLLAKRLGSEWRLRPLRHACEPYDLSPDSRKLAYVAHGRLRILALPQS